MCVKNAMQLSLNGDTFEGMKEDFDAVLARTIKNMESKGADEATITLKLGISLSKEQAKFPSEETEGKEIVKPDFKHVISSMMQVKDKKTGSLSGDYELVWDEDEEKYVMRKISDGQLSFFDDDIDDDLGEEDSESNGDEAPEEYDPAYDVETPFGWLRQYIGEKLTITEAMGNYTVRTEDNTILLTSASEEDSPFHCDAEKLAPHVGHKVVCVGYGGEILVNIAIECEDCCETLFSISLDMDEEDLPDNFGDEDDYSEDEYNYDEPELV